MKSAERKRPVVVAVDGSRCSLAAFAAALEMAEAWQRDLLVLYVEDESLLRLAGLPFCREVGSYTAAVRLLTDDEVVRAFRRTRRAIAALVEEEAAARAVPMRLAVVRSSVLPALKEHYSSAMLLALGRVGHSPGLGLGATARWLVHHVRAGIPLLVAGRLGLLKDGLEVAQGSGEAHERAQRFADSLASSLGVPVFGVGDDATLPAEGSVPVLVLPPEQVEVLMRTERTVILVP